MTKGFYINVSFVFFSSVKKIAKYINMESFLGLKMVVLKKRKYTEAKEHLLKRGLVRKEKDFNLIVCSVKNFISQCNLVLIILFGSAVESIHTAKDYDVLIVVKKLPVKDWLLAGKIKAFLIAKLGKPLDIVFLEKEDLAFPSPFLYEVSKKNKVLYGEDILLLSNINRNISVLCEGGVNVGWQIA